MAPEKKPPKGLGGSATGVGSALGASSTLAAGAGGGSGSVGALTLGASSALGAAQRSLVCKIMTKMSKVQLKGAQGILTCESVTQLLKS